MIRRIWISKINFDSPKLNLDLKNKLRFEKLTSIQETKRRFHK